MYYLYALHAYNFPTVILLTSDLHMHTQIYEYFACRNRSESAPFVSSASLSGFSSTSFGTAGMLAIFYLFKNLENKCLVS